MGRLASFIFLFILIECVSVFLYANKEDIEVVSTDSEKINLLDVVDLKEGWKLLKESEGIRIYSRGVKGFALDEFLAVAIIDSPPEVICDVLLDVPSQPQWMAYCKKSRIVQHKSEFDFIFHHVIDFPWPLSDRDVLVTSISEMDFKKGIFLAKFRSFNKPIIPKLDGVIRLTKMMGKWDFKRTKSNRTLFIYNSSADPGGYIPSFLTNWFSKDIPFLTIKGMRKMVKKAKYIESAKKRNY